MSKPKTNADVDAKYNSIVERISHFRKELLEPFLEQIQDETDSEIGKEQILAVCDIILNRVPSPQDIVLLQIAESFLRGSIRVDLGVFIPDQKDDDDDDEEGITLDHKCFKPID